VAGRSEDPRPATPREIRKSPRDQTAYAQGAPEPGEPPGWPISCSHRGSSARPVPAVASTGTLRSVKSCRSAAGQPFLTAATIGCSACWGWERAGTTVITRFRSRPWHETCGLDGR
jgi:hypothetical protein